MTTKVLLLLGTKKGAFIFESDSARNDWRLSGPYCEAWPIYHVIADHETGVIYAGGGNAWFGPAVWKTTDFGANWTHSSEGLAYGEGEAPVSSVWSLANGAGRLYAGVEPAGLFQSKDGGRSWSHVHGLRDHSTRSQWQPGGAGLILHSIVPHPNGKAIWVAMSAVGVFYSGDQGKSWEPRNRGTRNDYAPDKYRGIRAPCISYPSTETRLDVTCLTRRRRCGGPRMEELLGRIADAVFPNRRLFLGFCGKRWQPTGLTPPVSTLAPARDTSTSALTRAIAGHALQTAYLRFTR